MLIHNMLLEKLFAENVRIFDFGYMSGYKMHWTGLSHPIVDVTVYPRGLVGKSLLAGQWIKNRIQKKGIRTHDS